MEKPTDWVALWRELVESHPRRAAANAESGGDLDFWRAKARSFDARVKRRWSRSSDTTRDFVASLVTRDATVLDIGAGTGSWAMLLARHARKVTAVEPSPAMIDVMQENLQAAGIDNVEIIRGRWPDVHVAPHDFSLCAHGMYGCADLPAFVHGMMAATRRICLLTARLPPADGVMAEAAMHIWGQPHDSPNGVVAYNALLQMGLIPNVLMEENGLWRRWAHDSLDEALAKVKGKFGLGDASEHDEFLADLLRQRLIHTDGRYIWPDGVRTALIYWSVADAEKPAPTTHFEDANWR